MHPASFTLGINHAPSPTDVASYFAESPASTSTARGRSRDSYDRDARGSDTERLSEKLKAGVPIPAFLPYYDTLQTADETQVMRFAYRHMLADPTVKGAFQTKILNVMATELTVKPPRWLKDDERSQEIAEYVEWNLKHGIHEGVPGMAWDVLSGALIDGYSVCEKVWGEPEPKGRWEKKRRLARLKAKDVNQDLVPELDEFKNIIGIRGLRYNDGTVFDPSLFVIYSHLGLFENPTGMSDFRGAYRPYWLLDTVWKLRMIGVEKRSMPVVVGHWKEELHRGKLEAALAKVRFQNWISAPESARIEALEIAGQSHQIFSETTRDLQAEINTAINGAVLGAMVGTGERGDSNVHKDTNDLRPWHLCAALAHILNDHDKGLVQDIVDRNFVGVGDYPIVSFGGIDDKELKESVGVDEALNRILQASGKTIDPENLAERYGRPIIDLPQQPAGGDPNDPMGGGGGQPAGDDQADPEQEQQENPTGSQYGPSDDEESESGLPWQDGAIENDPDDTSVADELSYDPHKEAAMAAVGAQHGPPSEEGFGDDGEQDDDDRGEDEETDPEDDEKTLADVLGSIGGGDAEDENGDDGDDEGDQDDDSEDKNGLVGSLFDDTAPEPQKGNK